MIDEKTLEGMKDFVKSLPSTDNIDCIGLSCGECPMDLRSTFELDDSDRYSCAVCIIYQMKEKLEKALDEA